MVPQPLLYRTVVTYFILDAPVSLIFYGLFKGTENHLRIHSVPTRRQTISVIFRSLILMLEHEVGGWRVGHPFQKPVALGIHYVNFVVAA